MIAPPLFPVPAAAVRVIARPTARHSGMLTRVVLRRAPWADDMAGWPEPGHQRKCAQRAPTPPRPRPPLVACARPAGIAKLFSPMPRLARSDGADALGVSVPKRRRHALTGGHGRNGAG